MKKRKTILDDGCCPNLVSGAEFTQPLGIPIIKRPKEIIIPKGIIPFSQRDKVSGKGDALGFYENDINFAEVIIQPENYINDFGRFDVLISPDNSLYLDGPLATHITNIYRNRAIGVYYQNKGLNVIPQVRWGNEYSYTCKYFPERIAFLGVEKKSIIAIGSYGCIGKWVNRYHFEAGLEAMMDTLTPKVVLVYGSMPERIFGKYEPYAKFVDYPDWTTRVHAEK